MNIIKINKVIKKINIILIIGCIFLIIYLKKRYSIIKIPDGIKILPSGAYILIDWEFYKGRKLKKDDIILYKNRKNNKIKIGKIILIDEKIGNYIIQTYNKEINIISLDYIKARVLMVLYTPSINNHIPP